jgi:hypothetical protein
MARLVTVVMLITDVMAVVVPQILLSAISGNAYRKFLIRPENRGRL